MGHKLDTNQYLDAVCQMLAEGAKSVPVPVVGNSMRPFLRTGDFVHVDLPGKLRKGDILLYRRSNGQYVLHRVMKIGKEHIWMLGDSQLEREKLHKDQICAQVTSAKVRGKHLSTGSMRWWMYAHPWRWLAPWRRRIAWLHQKLVK